LVDKKIQLVNLSTRQLIPSFHWSPVTGHWSLVVLQPVQRVFGLLTLTSKNRQKDRQDPV
jgi:hypothetical protein